LSHCLLDASDSSGPPLGERLAEDVSH